MKKSISGVLLFTIYIGIVGPFSPAVSGQVAGRPINRNIVDLPNGLQFRLSEGEGGAGARTTQMPVSADPLSPDQTNGLLKRLRDIKDTASDRSDFAKRAGSLPPPKTGRQIPVRFPADDSRGTPKIDPGTTVEVVRYSPEGEVSLAPDLNITFSQPMVAVSSQDQAAQFAPVELSPNVEGRWRWLGTKSLMFDTDKRFPMATKFVARVPAGTRSATGHTLQKDFSWNFTTPPPKIERSFPEDRVVRRDAIIFVEFDQAIDPAAVLRSVNVASRNQNIPVRLATQEEVDSDSSVGNMAKQALPGRWMALRAIGSDGQSANALPADSQVTVTFREGTPSAEGPLTTTKRQVFSFTTFGEFKFADAKCGWQGNNKCTPYDQWILTFNNPIDPATFTREMVKIEPAVEGLKVFPSGNRIYVDGYKKGRTTYKVTVDGSLKDEFGQFLSVPATASIKVGAAVPRLYGQGGPMSVLDPAAKPAFSVYTVNHGSLKVRLYKVEPKDWHQFQQYYRRLNYDDGQRPTLPGSLVYDRTVSVKGTPDEIAETQIDLSPALVRGLGNVIVDIEPTVRRNEYDRARIFTWLQATQIGLDAFVDSSELVGFATDLQTGRPLSGVDLSIFPNGNGAGTQISDNIEGAGIVAQAWDWLRETVIGNGPSAGSVDGDIVELEPVGAAQSNRTGTNGTLRLQLSDNPSGNGANLLIARRGDDVAFLPENSDYYWQEGGSWHKKPQPDSTRWFVFDDRQMYRPNEEVSVKGYIRVVEGGKLGDVAGIADSASGITWSVKDPRNNEIAKGTGSLNAFGAFDLKFKLPDNANLGYARIDLSTASSLQGSSHSHQFSIQEFRRPEFEVTAKVDTEAPHFVGSSAVVSVEAKYYSGGGLANAEINWTVTATPTNYTPPNRDDFTFGTWVPWWRSYGYGRPYSGGNTQTFQGVTDASGKHLLRVDFDAVNPPRPYTVSASAAVQDVNRQVWSGQTSLLVHPSELYVGLRSDRTFVQKGENIRIESIVADTDGKLISGRAVSTTAVLKDWQFDKGTWKEVIVDEQSCSVTSADAAQECRFTAKQGGRYTITARVMDDRERPNESEITIWVPGGKTPPNRSVEQEEVQIIPSKKDYAPGEVAELLVMSPFTPAEGVLTLRRDGMVKTERFSMKDSSVTLKVPLDEKYLPNIYAQVDLVGAVTRTDDKGEPAPAIAKRPAFASGNINLSISTASRQLSVSAEPLEKTLVPGGSTKVEVQVKNNGGEPVANSEVAVVIVDESVLALSGYTVADPVSIFYSQRGPGTTDYHLRKDILLANPDDVKSPPPAPPVETADAAIAGVGQAGDARKTRSLLRMSPGVLAEKEEKSTDLISVRENFDALAVFAPSVRTDANGRATVDVKLPDNLTRYRVTAVAVDAEKRFGKSQSTITARQPLMVRPSAPRFMNFGDKIELPIVIQNQTDQDMPVDVAVRATNAELTDGSGKRLKVKANSREEVRFAVSAMRAGTARFQIAANSGGYSDAAEISLPVWTPATTEAFATYGTTDQNGAVLQPVQTPGNVYSQFGGLEVTTSSTQLQELTDAFIYLYRYPFECTEQVASRMISIAALKDVLMAFKAKEMPNEGDIKASFDKDIKILQSRQRNDGSFGLWRRDGERYKYPFLTVHTAHSLALAKAKGYRVPEEMLNKAKPYIKDVEKHFDQWHSSSQVRWTISAYALYVRDLIGDKDTAKTKKLLAEATIEKMPFEALGWVLSVLAGDPGSEDEVAAIKRHLMNRTTETASAANFVTDYGDGQWLIMHSNRRADGVLLEALIKADPQNDIIPKLVRGLLDHRKEGRWSSTQENVFILLALDKYFKAFEKVTPDFVTRVWLGSAYGGERQFSGRTVDSNLLTIPMSYLIDQGGTSNLILDKQGPGRLYYRIGMKYAPTNLKLDPADYGFTVLRRYEAVDDAEDVKQNADGSWTMRSGSRIRVKLTMVAQARRYHVALVDNLPAGLEILNPGLAVTEAIPADAGGGNTGVVEYGSRSYGFGSLWWRANWFEHQNFRDERAEAFSSLLWEGVYNYTYVARATTPGEFVAPPAKAEEMYHPETFGRTGTDFVTVK